MSDQDGGPKLTTSDEALVEQTRAGDQRAFAELWRRHFRSGARVARQFTSSIDADDLVSEAYTRIYQRVLAGGGPTGAFRPYLFTTIRNLASSWGAARKDVQVDDITDFEDPATLDDPAAVALDKTLTARAFRSLPERWQSVLWYTEVEGMDPHEVAPILGMTANGVAALSYRAREGLRKAWLQAHINDATASGQCQWTISKLGDHARRGLGSRDLERMTDHLATCAKCAIINEEVDEVGSRLALVMIPLLLGGVAGGSYLASFGTATTTVHAAASAAAIPALPEAITAGGAATAGAVGLFGAATTPILVGSLALVVAGGGVVLANQDPPVPETVLTSAADPDSSAEDAARPAEASPQSPIVPINDSEPAADDPANIPDGGGVGDLVGGVVDGVGGVVDGVESGILNPVLETVLPSVHADITITGHGTPGAKVVASADGIANVYTTVGGDGTFALVVSGLPGDIASVTVSQDTSNLLLGGLLGQLIPLRLDDGGLLGVVFSIL
jgi:RNA polymerase sigma factor (sigma-70 family)